jgi:hypothetical protein
MATKPPSSGPEALAHLQKALEAAVGLAQELADDPLLGRMIAVFRSMPSEDRPTILAILEREVAGRLLSRATEKPLGQATHLNPNARLYVRSHSSKLDRRHFDRDEMVLADIRAMRIAPMIRYVPDIYSVWKEALREALDHVEPSARDVAEDLLRDALAAIADARAEEQASAPADTPPGATERTRRS